MSTDDVGPPAGPSDQELVERLQQGDSDAARELYLRYYDRLLRFAYGYVHSRDIAEEVVQDTFLAVLERRATLELRAGIRTYLYTAVRNRALKWLDHDRVVNRAEALAAEEQQALGMGGGVVPPDVHLEADALAAAVARAIAALPEKRRMALTLRWRHRLPYAEIAAIMGTTVAAVTIQVARARETIAALIQDYVEE